MITSDPNRKEKTLEECISGLECLFKNSKGSDYNYQLEVDDSEFNILKRHVLMKENEDSSFDIENKNFKRYIRTKDGRIIDIEAFINKEKENPYYCEHKFEEIKNDDDTCAIYWTAIGTNINSIKDQIGRRLQYGATIDSPFIKQANTIEELIQDGDILYIYDLYPDTVLVVEGNIKPFGYNKVIKLKEWLKYDFIKFDLYIKDEINNYIKVAHREPKEELELL